MESKTQLNDDFYRTYDVWKEWSEESFGRMQTALEGTYISLLDRYAPPPPAGALDFGFGNGELLSCLRKKGYTVVGVERSERLRATAHREGFLVADQLESGIQLAGTRLSVITAFHVLEHLTKEQLATAVSRMGAALLPGGVILAAFPNGDSPFSGPAYNGDITHQTLIGSSLAAQLGISSGLRLSAFTGFPPVSSFAPDLAARVKSAIRHRFELISNRWFNLVYYGGQRRELSPVAVAVWVKS